MLKIVVPEREFYDEANNEFITIKEQTLQLEHSLVSLSKWESKWHKPYLNKEDKSVAEVLDYIRCMTITQNVNELVYKNLSVENIEEIKKYIEDPMTATTVNETNSKRSNEIVTSELIYYWMIAYNIPMECQKWHLNRLLTLVKVCSVKNTPPKKMSRREIMNRNAALNAARRKRLGTKG